MHHARPDPGFEPPCVRIRRDGRLKQPAVLAGAHEPGEQLGIRTPCSLEQAHHRIHGATDVDLELGEQFVRQWKLVVDLRALA